MRAEELVEAAQREGGAAGEQIVKDASERIDIGAAVEGGAPDLLGREKEGRAEQESGAVGAASPAMAWADSVTSFAMPKSRIFTTRGASSRAGSQ